MSVLIKGVELPKNCYECQFSDVYGDEWICGMHHSNCPLVEVATPHGRLIDADALLESIKEARKKDPEIEDVYIDDYFTVAEWLVSAPTIIEKEEKT